MISEICNREFCTGCSACASVCPKNCIRMEADDEGFLRPVIDEKLCVSCDKCRRTCPVNKPLMDDGAEPQSFAARCRDEQIVAKSSSGGLFSTFSMTILKRGGAVIGASFDENFQVVHKVCTNVDSLDELRRSKYVQSQIGTVYQEAQGMLDSGREVLFCGTACQVAGIKAYLGKEYDNLFTVDFICHGTPSPLAYNRYLDYLREIYKSDICEVNFRSKERGWHTHSLSVKFADGQTYSESVAEDYFMRSFIMDMNLRPSCYHCQFKQKHRITDITLADFWGAERCNAAWNDDTGISLVMIHSDRGQRLFDDCSNMIEATEVPFVEAIQSNPSMTRSVRKPPLRDSFMKDLKEVRYDKLHKKYCSTSIGSRIRRKLAQIADR